MKHVTLDLNFGRRMLQEHAVWFVLLILLAVAALVSGAFYVPIEILELVRRPTWFKWVILTVNVLIVLYIAWFLMDSHRRKKEEGPPKVAS